MRKMNAHCFHCWNQHSLGYPKRVGFRSSTIHLSTFNAFCSVDAEEGEANAYAIPGTEASLDLAYTIVMPIKKPEPHLWKDLHQNPKKLYPRRLSLNEGLHQVIYKQRAHINMGTELNARGEGKK